MISRAVAGGVHRAPRARTAAVLAVPAAGGCGAYDDLAGADDPRRGFRAHLTALRHGEVTSDAVKLFGIGAAGSPQVRSSRTGPSTASSAAS